MFQKQLVREAFFNWKSDWCEINVLCFFNTLLNVVYRLAYTSLAKPLSQFFSHIPQLYVTYQKKSTEGVSLASQHLNFVGGIFGMYSTYNKCILFI